VAVDLVVAEDTLGPGRGDPGVVARELLELAAPEQVGAAVPAEPIVTILPDTMAATSVVPIPV
jgi:hypothetical protein